ncbi:MAG: hypothetical protein FWD47_15255 [Treponema sp.]|nr:hypothetical protein [Treponema sp.]
MNIPALIFSILAIISGILWFVFWGISPIIAEDNITMAQIFYLGYNIALSLIGGILGIKYSLRDTKKYGAKIFIIASGVILMITGRLVCGLLLVISGGLLIYKTLSSSKETSV